MKKFFFFYIMRMYERMKIYIFFLHKWMYVRMHENIFLIELKNKICNACQENFLIFFIYFFISPKSFFRK